MNTEFLQLLERERPILKRLLHEYEHTPVGELARAAIAGCGLLIHPRSNEFIGVVAEIARERLGDAMADRVVRQFSNYYGALTTDHHGTLNSPLGVAANIMYAENVRAYNDPNVSMVPVLSCASISQHNEEYPRGLLFNAENLGIYNSYGVSLLPSQSKGSAVWNFRPFTPEEAGRMKKYIQNYVDTGTITNEIGNRLAVLTESLYEDPDILQADTLCAQFTRVNFELWKKIYSGVSAAPDLLMIEQEEIVVRLLLSYHMQQNTVIHDLIFGKASDLLSALEDSVIRYMRQGSLNTYLFWWVSDKNRRVNMRREGQMLVSEDGEIQIPLEPESVADALRNHRLMPNLLLLHTVIYLYYGLNCVGGFNQIHFHTLMQDRYNASGLDGIPTQAQSFYAYGLAPVLLHPDSDRMPHAADILLYPELNLLELFQKSITTLTVGQIFQKDWKIIHTILSQ